MLKAVCVKGRTQEHRVLPGSKISIRHEGCASRRVSTRLFSFVPNIVDSFVWIHSDCVCNEVIALRQRHQLDDNSRYTSGWDLRKLLAKHVFRATPVSEQFIINKAPDVRRRKALEAARDSLAVYPLEPKDGRVKMFIKPDKYHTSKYGPPRCIQYRDKRYALPLATYIHPIEHEMFNWEDDSGTSIFAKAKNHIQRGNDIAAKMQYFENPVAISLDHSKFDSHVNKRLLELEHWFYRMCYPGDRYLKRLLDMQLINSGSTRNGTLYKTKATRMSGDQNTSCGNSLINYAMTLALKQHLNIKMAMYIDGDDFIIFVDKVNQSLITPSWYEQFGMKTTLESSSSVIEQIDFCQCRPVFNGNGYTMVRNPDRMLSRVQWYVGRIDAKYKLSLLKSVGMCEMSLGMGLPVGQYVGNLLASLKGRYVITNQHHSASKMPYRPGKARLVPPSMATRMSYEEAWGVSISQQIAYETLQLNLEPEVVAEEYEEQPFVCRLQSWSITRLRRDKFETAELPRRNAAMETGVMVNRPEPHCCPQA